MKKVHIGTSGFYYKDWLTHFYPQDIKKGEYLSFYAMHFTTVEINNSFYTLLKAKTVENWVEKVPEDFIFSLKVSRYITHMKKLIYDEDSLLNYFEPLTILKERKNLPVDRQEIIEFQLPPSLVCSIEKLEILLPKLPTEFRYAFEFRHESWFTEEVYEILRKYNISIVFSDSPIQAGKRLWPYHDIETADFSYIRFHGSKALFASSYTDKELEKYSELIQNKVKKGIEVFCYFNNDINGHAVQNAKTSIKLINN